MVPLLLHLLVDVISCIYLWGNHEGNLGQLTLIISQYNFNMGLPSSCFFIGGFTRYLGAFLFFLTFDLRLIYPMAAARAAIAMHRAMSWAAIFVCRDKNALWMEICHHTLSPLCNYVNQVSCHETSQRIVAVCRDVADRCRDTGVVTNVGRDRGSKSTCVVANVMSTS